VLGQKSKLPWNAVKRNWRQLADVWRLARLARRVCRRLRRNGRRVDDNPTGVRAGSLLRKERSPAIPATDRRRWSETAPACNRLSESILLLFVTYNLAESVSLCILFFVISWRGIKACDSSIYCGLCESCVNFFGHFPSFCGCDSFFFLLFFSSSLFFILLNVNICKII